MNSLFLEAFLIGVALTAVLFFAFAWVRRQQQQKQLEISQQEALAKQAASEAQAQAIQQEMARQFEVLASRMIEQKSQQFEERSARMQDQSLQNLQLLLNPLRDRLHEFTKKVEDTYAVERAERGSLRGELSKLMELNARMSNETSNLTRALKGDVKTQGNWGEMVLENILERSGLRRDEEYVIQATGLSLKNDEGEVIRPDVIVNLPEQKHIIIDSKVSLQAYEQYSSVEDRAEQEKWAKAHVESLKKHIQGLSDKKYHSSEKLLTPDFVILFMPIEPAFALAFKHQPDLLQMAWDRNVALVSPTTLLTTLRTVATLWRTERQERNAIEIARRGGALYDKFAALVEDLKALGDKMQTSQKAYQQVMNKLSEGQGNLIRQVDMLRELGVKTEKRLQKSQATEALESPESISDKSTRAEV